MVGSIDDGSRFILWTHLATTQEIISPVILCRFPFSKLPILLPTKMSLVSRLWRLLDPGADEEGAARIGRAPRKDRIHQRYRMQQPISVLHEHLWHAQHSWSCTDIRDGIEIDTPGLDGLGDYR